MTSPSRTTAKAQQIGQNRVRPGDSLRATLSPREVSGKVGSRSALICHLATLALLAALVLAGPAQARGFTGAGLAVELMHRTL